MTRAKRSPVRPRVPMARLNTAVIEDRLDLFYRQLLLLVEGWVIDPLLLAGDPGYQAMVMFEVIVARAEGHTEFR